MSERVIERGLSDREKEGDGESCLRERGLRESCLRELSERKRERCLRERNRELSEKEKGVCLRERELSEKEGSV